MRVLVTAIELPLKELIKGANHKELKFWQFDNFYHAVLTAPVQA
jgi:hypothetical protein